MFLRMGGIAFFMKSPFVDEDNGHKASIFNQGATFTLNRLIDNGDGEG